MFFIIPCVDIVEIVDMRVQVFNVPPQEVGIISIMSIETVILVLNIMIRY